MSRTNLVTLVAYLLTISTLLVGLFITRSRVMAQPDPDQSQQAWQEWRNEAERQAAGTGPVTRRVPAAQEAPTLLLLRDHFLACLTLTLLISTVLFATFAFMIRGVLMGPPFNVEHDRDSSH